MICKKCEKGLITAARLKKIALVADNFLRKRTKEAEINLWKFSELLKQEPVEFILSTAEAFKVEIEESTKKSGEDEIRADSEVINYVKEEDSDFEWKESESSPGVEKFLSSLTKKTRHESQKFITSSNGTKQCSICGKSFRGMKRLKEHITFRHQEIPEENWIPCKVCGKKFKVQSFVDRHLRSNHIQPKDQQKAACSICGKVMIKTSLRAHEKRHLRDQAQENTKPYSCDICGQAKAEKSYLIRHLERVHLRLKK